MSMRTATQVLRRSLSTAQTPATPAIRVAASPLAGAPLARGRAEIGAIHHGFAHEDPRPKRKNATRVLPNSIDRPQAACPETGLTYDRKYDCELLRGATVLNEKNGFGLRIPSCDLRGAASWPEEAVSAVRAVIQDARGVLTFPNQRDLTPTEHVALAARFGDVERHMVAKGLPGCPEILEIVRERGVSIIFGEEWHSDHSFQPLPASFSFLRATAEMTPVGTNNTEFAQTEAAWAALSPAMQALLLPLDAYHSAGKAYGDGAKYGKTTPNSKEAMAQTSTMEFAVEKEDDIIADVVHPVVARRPSGYRTRRSWLAMCFKRTTPAVQRCKNDRRWPSSLRVRSTAQARHAETGRDAIFISETFTNGIVGMTAREGLELTQLIQRHVTQECFRVEVAYEPFQLTMWDNRQLIHRGLTNDNSSRRIIQRASVSAGARPRATRDFL